jgi:hypothetical protein
MIDVGCLRSWLPSFTAPDQIDPGQERFDEKGQAFAVIGSDADDGFV